jgi:Carboxypeptidase regulatory-like domain
MTTGIGAGTSKQRGFWLRCFLGRALFAMALGVLASAIAWAKVEAPGALHLWRLHGFFMDRAGKPIENVEVTLVRDGTVLHKTKTDASGEFAFDHVSGHYRLHIDKSNRFSELSREVIVGLETAMMLRSNTLYVVAGPGACTDDCSSVFTSKSDFEKAIRRNKPHGAD